MNLGMIDLSLKPLSPKLSICLPNLERTVIGRLSEARDITLDVLLGKINELQFKVDYSIEKQNKLIKNPSIDKLKERYLIKFQLGKEIEYFIITSINDTSDNNEASKTVSCNSLGYELADKLIRGYEDISINATDALNVALLETLWTVDYVDSDFDIRYRSFEVSEKTCLDFVFEIADTFNAIVEFDTVNRLVSLKKEENIGADKGLRLSYGKYLTSIDKEIDALEVVTRLHVFGNEGLSIQNVNQTGTTYLEDFSYFMYPYEEDENGNIIKHSHYMSDSLCKAITKYNKLINTKKTEFSNLLAQLTSKQSELAIREVELDTLKNELKIIDDKIDFAKAKGIDYSDLTSQQNAKQTEITNKESQITLLKSDISNVNNLIQVLRDSISIKKNFTSDQIKERNIYIIEKTWQDDNFIDENDLFEEAVRRFNDMKKPRATFSIDIVNFLNIVEEQRNWDKLSIGDTVTIKYDMLDVLVKAKIIEIHYDYEGNNITLTISDTINDISDEGDKLVKKLYEAYSTSTSLDMNKYKWDQSANKLGEINDIINSEYDATKKQILAGVNNSVKISGRGITIENPDEPNKMLVAQAGVLALTLDGNEWKTAIKPEGIIAERLMGKIVTSVNLFVENQSGKYRMDADGFTIENGSLNIIGGLPSSQIDIEDLKGKVTDYRVDDILSDMKVTSIEKEELNRDWEAIKSEYAQLIALAISLGVAYTDYQTAYNNLDSLSPKIASEILADKNSTYTFESTSARDNFNSKIKTYFTESDKLSKAITEKVQSNADTAQRNATTAQNYINDMLSDLKITALEKIELSREWEAIKAEYTQLIALANSLSVPITNYQTAYNNMDSVTPKVATDILKDMSTTYTFSTSTDRDNFKNKFTNYYSESQKLSKAISDKIQASANSAQNTANSAMSNINDMLSDLKITPLEKVLLSRDWDAIKSQYTQISALGDSLGVITTTYKTAYNNLDGTSPKIATDILKDMNSTYTFVTTTDRDNFKSKITNYYNEADKLSKAITEKVNENANQGIREGSVYNGVKIDATNGLVVTKETKSGSLTTINGRVVLNATEGIKVQKTTDNGSTWTDNFYLDTSGNINMVGNLTVNKSDGSYKVVLDSVEGIAIKKKVGSNWTDQFNIDGSGNLSLTGNINMTGGNISAGTINLGNGNLVVDGSGNVSVRGNITMTGGSISWTNINKPSYTVGEISGAASTTYVDYKVASSGGVSQAYVDMELAKKLSTDSPRLTKIDANGIYTGRLEANQIVAGTLTGFSINGGTMNIANGKLIVNSSGDLTIKGAVIYANGTNGSEFLYTNAIDTNPIGSGVHIYTRPTSSGELRITASGTTDSYRPVRTQGVITGYTNLYLQGSEIRAVSSSETSWGSYHTYSDFRGQNIYAQGSIYEGGSSLSSKYASSSHTHSSIDTGYIRLSGGVIEATSGTMWIGANTLKANIIQVLNGTTTSSANVNMASDGRLTKVTSAMKYKTDIKEVNLSNGYHERILNIKPKSWYDKAELERYSSGQEMFINRVYGLIAEDVEQAGLGEYVVYEYKKDGTKEIEGVAYERLWTLLIPVARRLNEKMEELESMLNILKEQNEQLILKNANLEERLSSLEIK